MMNIFRLRETLVTNFYGVLLRPFFAKCGTNLKIDSPLKIDGFKNIHLGNNIKIGYKTWLAGSTAIQINPILSIGSGSTIGSFNHIFSTKLIKIGENVLTADKVYISDNLHNYTDPTMPIIRQVVKQINSVEIGDGTWIGENACIIGAKIGKNCVIGANAVVTKDIPDYSIVVGAPGIIIKKYNFDTNSWERTNKIGEFL